MPDDKLDPYRFQPLDRFSFGQRIAIRVIGFALYLTIRLIGITLRFDMDGDFDRKDYEGEVKPILCLWHDRVIAGTYYVRGNGVVAIVSMSFDGEYTSRAIQRLGYGVVKGSSSRNGMRALAEMIRMMGSGFPMAVTIDGPRGPRHVAKRGPIYLAKMTGNPIIPTSVEVKHCWTINSWDKMQIPIPFSRAMAYAAAPIHVPPDAGEDEIEVKRLEVEEALNDLARRGAEWAGRS